MDYRRLGNTDLKISEICLGSMTWREQNTEIDAQEKLDFALPKEINFHTIKEEGGLYFHFSAYLLNRFFFLE